MRLRKHLYQKSYNLNDFKSCLHIAADLAKLQRQYTAEVEKNRKSRPAEAEGPPPQWQGLKSLK